MQDEFLHAPIEQFSDKDFVLGRTGDFVDPTKLLELLTRLSQNAQHLTGQGKLIDAPRMSVGRVEYLTGGAA
jgi:hypothetical protein